MLQTVLNKYSDDITEVTQFCNEKYCELFGDHFKEVHNLYTRMKSNVSPISDSELEYILIMLPLELIEVAEKLNNLRLEQEVIKLKNKEAYETARSELLTEAQSLDLNKTATQEYITHGLNKIMVEYEITLSAYESITTRVANEQSFSKELIMGAKKVWDSRRSSESVNPVKPIASDLPDYDPTSNKAYIK